MEYVENKELEEREIKNIFADMVKYAPSKLCGMVGNMITVPIYTSMLNQEQYGIYTVAIAMLSFMCIIFSDWVGLSGLRFFRQNQLIDNLPKYVSTLVTILITNLLVMVSLATVFAPKLYSLFVKNSDFMIYEVFLKYLAAVLLLIIPVAVRALLSQILRAQLKSISYTVTTILNQFATIALAVVLQKCFNLGAVSILLSMGISITLIDFLLLFQSGVFKIFKFQKIEWKFILPIMRYGVPIAATSLSSWIITQSNKVIMNKMSDVGFSKAALVGVGYSLTLSILLTIFAIITVAAIPRIINMYEAKLDVRRPITKFLGYYLLLSLPVIVLISIYSTDYTHLFVKNPNMYEASVLVPFFSMGAFFLALTDYTTLQYHLANKTDIEFIIKLASGIVGVIMNIQLIPTMGIYGVGVAMLAANFVYFLLSVIIVLPGFKLEMPTKMISRLTLTFLPIWGLIYLFRYLKINVPGIVQLASLILLYYLIYFGYARKVIKSN